MQDFINWIVDNWQFVSSVAISIVGFILLFLRKRFKIVDSACEYLLSVIPAAVRYSEDKYKEIAENSMHIYSINKKEWALSYVKERFLRQFPSSNWSEYKSYVSFLIEDVLNTPQKKGGK